MNSSLVALTPAGMLAAQSECGGWADKKLSEAKHELVIAEQNFNALAKAKVRTNTAQTMIRKARKRIMFYEKVKAALDAGYYIIPPFDVQVFAIRTDRASPSELSERTWEKELNPRALPVGEGCYVDPRPERIHIDNEERISRDGKPYSVKLFENADWKDVELPVRAIKPQIIEETGRALALKIFDALGIAPAFRSADPIIAGQLMNPKGGAPLTFFVAWWLDYSDF